jgi:hypothetical protein
MLYESRLYITVPGKLPAINDRFAKYTIGFFKKYGIGILGFWNDEIGTSNQLTYILAFDSMADREQKWGAFQADPGWHQVRAETEASGPIVAQVINTFYAADPLLTSAVPDPLQGAGIARLRCYAGEAASPA